MKEVQRKARWEWCGSQGLRLLCLCSITPRVWLSSSRFLHGLRWLIGFQPSSVGPDCKKVKGK